MDSMDRTVSKDVKANVQDVTTLTIPVIVDVIRDRKETTVKNVMHLLSYSLNVIYEFFLTRHVFSADLRFCNFRKVSNFYMIRP